VSSATEGFGAATNTIFADLTRNKDQAASARQYPLDTLTWAREIMGQLPATYRTVREILSLPSERCLQQKFMNFRLRVRQALTDIAHINLLISIWREAKGISGSADSFSAILSVDAAALRLTVTFDESGKMEGLDRIHHLDAPDIFTQFILNPCAFRDFVLSHFDRAYSLLFVYQIQPINPRFTCRLVHATSAINGKGNEGTVMTLEAIAAKLRDASFPVLGYAFDGDSYFNSLHDGFENAWEEKLSSGTPNFFET
jgi:hypothetical protein